MLVLPPPFIESDGVGIERDLGLHVRPVTGEVYHDLESHYLLVIERVGPPEFADERIEYFHLVHMQVFLPDDHPVDPHGIRIQPLADPHGADTLPGIKREIIFRVVDFVGIQRVIFH